MEIKSIDGKVLYVAKDAKDIRIALEEAVRSGADLSEANLSGANLSEADLSGADLSRATWTKVAQTLRESIVAMNDSGRHWIKGALNKALDDGTMAYCAIGSVEACNNDATIRAIAFWLLQSVCAGDIATFNDHKSTTWEDVQAVFAVAIKHAERFAG